MTKYLMRPFVTVEIDEHGRMTVDYDDCESMLGRMTGDDDQYEDYDGGSDWDAASPAYERWAVDAGLRSVDDDGRGVLDYNVVATISVLLIDVVPAFNAHQAMLAGCASVELLRDDLDQAILDAGLDGRVATSDEPPVMRSATPVAPRADRSAETGDAR
jgi:hypothetical protein